MYDEWCCFDLPNGKTNASRRNRFSAGAFDPAQQSVVKPRVFGRCQPRGERLYPGTTLAGNSPLPLESKTEDLALCSYGGQALAVEIDKMFGVFFGARNRTALKSCAGGSGAAIAGCGGDEFHHLQCDLLITSQRWCRRNGIGWGIAHGNSPRLELKKHRAALRNGGTEPMITDMKCGTEGSIAVGSGSECPLPVS